MESFLLFKIFTPWRSVAASACFLASHFSGSGTWLLLSWPLSSHGRLSSFQLTIDNEGYHVLFGRLYLFHVKQFLWNISKDIRRSLWIINIIREHLKQIWFNYYFSLLQTDKMGSRLAVKPWRNMFHLPRSFSQIYLVGPNSVGTS